MGTRRSPKKQQRLWKELGEQGAEKKKKAPPEDPVATAEKLLAAAEALGTVRKRTIDQLKRDVLRAKMKRALKRGGPNLQAVPRTSSESRAIRDALASHPRRLSALTKHTFVVQGGSPWCGACGQLLEHGNHGRRPAEEHPDPHFNDFESHMDVLGWEPGDS